MTVIGHMDRREVGMSRQPERERGLRFQLWRAIQDCVAPWGYQDVAGFHFGVPPQLAADEVKRHRHE